MTAPAPHLRPLEPAPPLLPPRRLRDVLARADHKAVGRAYLWVGMAALLAGGLMAMAIRWQWAYPGRPLPALGALLPESGGALTPSAYTGLFTLHGLVMVFFAVGPLLSQALGTLLLPLLLGAPDLAFPRLTRAGFACYLASVGLLLAACLAELGPPSAGWTAYPPLSTLVGSPGTGQTWMLAALLVNALGSLLWSLNAVATVLGRRAPGMGLLRMPLTAWGLLYTALLNCLFLPVLAAAGLLLLSDRVLGSEFFIAGVAARLRGGDPLLYQHLFWMFGHPEVYILILPAWGLLGDLVAHFGRKPAHWYRGTVGAMGAVVVLSGFVYAHHMATTGLSPLVGRAFAALTLLISVPAEVMALNWLLTLWRGSVRLESPLLAALGSLLVFGLGGVTGLVLGAQATDVPLHDTLWVVGHFHLTMGASSFLALFAAVNYWFPKFTGRRLHEGAARVHAVGTTVLLVAVFGGLLLAGWSGQHRRLYDPNDSPFFSHLAGLTRATSHAAFALGALQLLFVGNLLWSLRRGRRAGDNPWEVGTLEWTCAPTPPPPGNFPVLPQVRRGPHAYAQPLWRAQLGRDWVGQAEVLPDEAPLPQVAGEVRP